MNIKSFLWINFASMLSLTSSLAVAEERVVRGEVVKVVPITETVTSRQTPTTCSYPKPTANSSLSALLAWDLLDDCNAVPITDIVTTGYRVFYKWDDRTYSRTMAERPGETIPLLLTVD